MIAHTSFNRIMLQQDGIVHQNYAVLFFRRLIFFIYSWNSWGSSKQLSLHSLPTAYTFTGFFCKDVLRMCCLNWRQAYFVWLFGAVHAFDWHLECWLHLCWSLDWKAPLSWKEHCASARSHDGSSRNSSSWSNCKGWPLLLAPRLCSQKDVCGFI